jgi:RNA polymerase sigma factor (sigma-70 family)
MTSKPSETALLDIRRLFGEGTVSGLSDAQLLGHFVASRDDAAFAALVAAHGPMVMSVCRHVLSDPNDVEDAFQATFLVLARKARSVRTAGSLGAWLHRVAHRVAVEANRDAVRRRARERRAVVKSASDRKGGCVPDDIGPALHEELARLPEKFRRPVVLCYLEGKTQEEAAAELRWSGATLRRRLAGARERLRTRLVRRGIAPSAGLLVAGLAGDVLAVVPPGLASATTRAASALVLGQAATSTAAVSLTRHVLRSLLMTQLKSATTVALTTGFTAWIALGLVAARHGGAGGPGPKPVPVAGPATPPDSGVDPLVYAGVVLDDEGRPLAGAKLSVSYPTADQDAFLRGSPSGPDGRFRFEVTRAAFDRSRQDNPWMYAAVMATADGFGPVWANAATPPLAGSQPADRMTLRLARDDVAIQGRILSTEGRPVAGAKVQPILLHYRQDRELVHIPWDREGAASGTTGSMSVKNLFPGVASDADGRFVLKGIGRERMVEVVVSGPDIATRSLEIETRPGPMRTLDGEGLIDKGKVPAKRIRFGSRFEYVAAPGRTVVGVVRERGSGRPVPGVRMDFREATDAQGRFRLGGLPYEDLYTFQVYPPAGRPYFSRVVTIEAKGTGLEPVTADVELTRGVLLRGRLTDKASGRPIRGFARYIPLKGNRHIDMLPTRPLSNRREAEGVTDLDGRFAFAVLPGSGVVVVQAGTGDNIWYPPVRRVSDADRARGLAYPAEQTLLDTVPRPTDLGRFNAYRVIDLPEEGVEAFDCDFAIDPGAMRGGPILDPDGRPLEGVTVYGLRDPAFDSWGQLASREFAVRNLVPGVPRRVFLFHEGRKLGGHHDVRADGPAPIEARLGPSGAVTGRLVDSKGTPMTEVHFRLVFEDAEGIPRIIAENREGKSTNTFWPRQSVPA